MFHSAFPRYFGKIRKVEACTADNFSTPIERKIERNFTAHNSSLIIARVTTLKWKFTWKQGSWNYVIRELHFIMNLRKSHMVLPLLSLLSILHIFLFSSFLLFSILPRDPCSLSSFETLCKLELCLLSSLICPVSAFVSQSMFSLLCLAFTFNWEI